MEFKVLAQSTNQEVKAKWTMVDSQRFLQILIPVKLEIAAIQADVLSELLTLIVGRSSIDIEAASYYAALNEALRHWSVKGA